MTTPAVMNVPKTPRATIGKADSRKLGQPMSRPPLNKITISATTATRSTVWIGVWWYRLGQMSEAAAAAIRKTAGGGIGSRSVSFDDNRASPKPALTKRMTVPKLAISLMTKQPPTRLPGTP